MNVGAIFQEDGIYKIVFKLGKMAGHKIRRFRSLEVMLEDLRSVNVPFAVLHNFVLLQLSRKINLLRELPGDATDWAQFAGCALQ